MMPSFAATRFTYDMRLRIRLGNDEVHHDQGLHFASNERTVGVCRDRYNWFTSKIERRIQYHRNTGKIGKTTYQTMVKRVVFLENSLQATGTIHVCRGRYLSLRVAETLFDLTLLDRKLADLTIIRLDLRGASSLGSLLSRFSRLSQVPLRLDLGITSQSALDLRGPTSQVPLDLESDVRAADLF